MSEIDLAGALAVVDDPGTKSAISCDVCGEIFTRGIDKANHVRITGHGKGDSKRAYKKEKGAPISKEKKEPRDKAPTGRKPPGRPSLEKRLADQFAAIGLMVSVADPHCGGVVVAGSERLAEAWSNLAKENATIKRILEGLLTTSAWGDALLSTAMIALPILRHHGMLPEGLNIPLQPIADDVEDQLASGVGTAA